MKILWLGNSNNRPSAEVPESELRHRLLEPRLADALGEPVEIVARQFWPTPDAAKVVEAFMGRYAPEVVYLATNSFWFNHESVPLRLERALGPFGPIVRRTTLAANDTSWFAHNRAYRSMRDYARRHIDGAYHFEPEEVVQRMTECIRAVLRSEGVMLLVRTPYGKRDSAPNARVRDRREAQRLVVHHNLKKLCEELHVDYLGNDRPAYLDRPLGPQDPALLQGDAFHRNAAGHRDDVEQKLARLLPICLKALEARAGERSGVARLMKILKLGSSGVQADRIPGAKLAHDIAATKLREALGEEVAMRAKFLWPSSGMTPSVQKWLRDDEPDVLYIIVSAFWFAYESVPLRLERRLGRVGKYLGTVGLRAADNPKVAYNAAFRAGRRAAHALVGGEAHFQPQYVVDEVANLLQTVLAGHEQMLVVVHGPQGWNAYHSSKRANRRAETRRLYVDAQLRDVCAELHVPYFGTALPLHERGISIQTVGDGLHAAEGSQEFLGEKDFRYLHEAITAHRQGQ